MADHTPSAREVWPLRPTHMSNRAPTAQCSSPPSAPLQPGGNGDVEKGVGGVEQHVWESLMWSVGVSDTR